MSKFFEPYKVFAALLIAVLFWLFPFIKHETVTVTPIDHGEIITVSDSMSAGARGPCSNVQCGPGFCCVQGACVPNNANNCNNGGPDQPPSITSDWNCSTWGVDSWCIGSLSLHLSASDPQGAAVIISGTLNGVAFACPNGAKSCSIPIPIEGIGDVTYRVHSATGLADSGTANYKLDFIAPQLDGLLSGVAGNNNWFLSNVVLDAIASDSESGLASFESVVDGGASTVISSPINLLDGVHIVTLTAVDVAGNVTQNTQTIQVDTITPILTTTVSGTNGANGWYVSSVVVTPMASDSGSGLAALEAMIDGGSWTIINSPISFTDGVHTYQFRATDNAGNTTESTPQTVKVDATTPVLSINITGTLGKNPSNGLNTGWYVSSVTATPVLVDATAGVGVVEATTDGGPWSIINSPISFQDGIHNYQIRVTDNAGNVTTTPVQNLKIDTIAPAIDMTETLSLGETVFYSLEDMGSGLFGYRAVIEDEDENYKKIVWVDQIGGNKIRDEILWDGKFADGASAGIGEYFITLKISDRAGNQTIKTAVVSVNLLSFMQELPTFTPPTALPVDQTTQTEDSPQTGFGGDSNQIEGGDVVMVSEGGNSHTWPADAVVSAGFSVPGKSSQQSIPFDPNIVWGAAAVALVGASVAEWRRQQEEHKANMMKLSAQRDAELANEAAIRASWAAEEMQQSRLADSLRWTGIASIAQAKQAAEQAAQQAAFNHRMDEHTGEQDVVDAWLAEQNRLNEHDTSIVSNQTSNGFFASIKNFIIPNIKNIINPKSIAPILLTVALGANTSQWINNIMSTPNVFEDASTYTQQEWNELLNLHPHTEENTQISYIFTHPYETFQIGFDATKAIANITSAYVDTVLQENPVNHLVVDLLQDLGDTCSQGFGENWARRCSAGLYFVADVVQHPVDTIVNLGTTLVAEPTAGLVKTASFLFENYNLVSIIQDVNQNGLSATIDDRINLIQTLLSDTSVESFLMLATFVTATILGFGLPALVLGTLMVVGQSAFTLVQIDNELQAASTLSDAMKIITDPKVRRQLATTLALLTLTLFGSVQGFKEFSTFKSTLSPSALNVFSDLPYLEQIRIFENSTRMGITPESLEFYLTETLRTDSPLAQLPLTEALRFSKLVEDYGVDMMSKFVSLCEKYEINLTEILSEPPSEGQNPSGWVLGIKNPENPVNHPYIKINLTDAQLNDILVKSAKNPNSKIIVLGYGGGVVKPYYILGEEIGGSYLSLSPEDWAPFESAKANFWLDLNLRYVQMGIDERKIFIFNVKYETITDSVNTERFSLPELRLLELSKNNYVEVGIGDYTVFVPSELMDTYRQYIPKNLTQSGE